MRTVTACTMAAAFASLLWPPLSGQSQPNEKGVTFNELMPLFNATEFIQQRSGKVVTYEDPLREWAGDVEPIAHNPKLTRPRRHSLTLPEAVMSVGPANPLTLEIVQRVVDAYHQQNPEGARFKAAQSEWGFHIIPVQVRDAKGVLVAANNPLDWQIEVPTASRTAREHLRALADAAGNAAGIRVLDASTYVDEFFGVNQYLAPGRSFRPEDRKHIVFDWGTKGVTAREALISLLSHSCSTLSWTAACVTSAVKEGETGCMFGVGVVMAGDPPRALQHNRCTGMRMLPTTTPRY